MTNPIIIAEQIVFRESRGYYMSWFSEINSGDVDVLFMDGQLTGHISQYGELRQLDADQLTEWRAKFNDAIRSTHSTIPSIPIV